MATRKSFYDLAAEGHAFKLFACLGAADARRWMDEASQTRFPICHCVKLFWGSLSRLVIALMPPRRRFSLVIGPRSLWAHPEYCVFFELRLHVDVKSQCDAPSRMFRSKIRSWHTLAHVLALRDLRLFKFHFD